MRLTVLALVATVALACGQRPTYVVPNSPDLTVTTRTVRPRSAGFFTTRNTLRLKGARQSMDVAFGNESGPHVLSTIGQCDMRRTLVLNHDEKLYAFHPLRDPPRLEDGTGRTGHAARESPEHPLQTMTIDAVDTGERRQFGALAARHVITTTTSEDRRVSPGRSTTEVRDGWYVDLPPVGCIDRGVSYSYSALAVGFRSTSSPPTLPVVRWVGRAKQGYPLIETIRSVGQEQTPMITTELLAVSADPIDPAVFDVPAGYRSALPRWDGSYDMSRPDTVFNRAALLWESVRDRASWYWR